MKSDRVEMVLSITRLAPGRAICYSEDDVREMAKVDMTSLLFGSPGLFDVERLLDKFRLIHGLSVQHDPIKRVYTFSNPEAPRP